VKTAFSTGGQIQLLPGGEILGLVDGAGLPAEGKAALPIHSTSGHRKRWG
jgi:hypothetical protein